MPLNWHIAKEPRDYQREALEWARQYQHAVCCLPTGSGKTLVGELWTADLFENGLTTHAIVLEPTRLLVNQVSDCFRDDAGVDAVPIDGRIPREQRLRLWAEPLVVCTAQTALNDWEHVRARA
ncbi:MAG: DEAD/DEAH box helicase family protein, partial [Dehalococcoidia bacterium]|nr:DEAD/DEAH box helicase family protein [Dehalococcoidia bacterium]